MMRLSPALIFALSGFSAAQPPLMKDFIGINGHTVQFKPELYQPAARLVRDYHPVEWDLGKETPVLPEFPFAKNKVDWSGVYGSWQKHGWVTNACLMFESIPRDQWKDIEKDAEAYGQAFAREFGPSGNRKLVESVEIGNEPGKWSDADYSRMYKAMATGLRAGDPRLKIATCNLTTGKSGDYEKSVSCLTGLTDLTDVLTIHTYAQMEGWPTWKRSFPEDPALPRYLKDVEDLCRWRDQHAKGKPVWITEFGYDSTTQPQEKTGDFAKWVGVTDEQQAQWLVRSFLVFSAMPVERAYLYFFNDEDKASLHASSGLTRNFKPKPSYHAVSHLQATLGDYRFAKIVRNTPALRIQEYRHESDGKIIWAVWAPTGESKGALTVIDETPGKLIAATMMPTTANAPQGALPLQPTPDSVETMVSGSPVYLTFQKAP
ncbi:cellulase family glycosylhydrolase [Luteolibacter flavescens]|uniref:Cellulase family glycosylhydrolase n=1 Tax=Luteolibacter flavescens TaxID=1859460 RepID=A0ABT3FIV9_9BACT|nr:cellulase family glycosylhydrolase [Luteolibacter flavescens]MCW1883387.1 cellulase family glycosylhydrolase [Luteolibacter flavescens]